MSGDPRALGRGLLLFWSLWLSVVFASNLADGLHQAGVLPDGWRFVSGNFGLLLAAIRIYDLPAAVAAVLFTGVVLTQLLGAVLFWRAFLDRHAVSTRHHAKAIAAFVVAIGLFAGMLVADELFVVYDRLPGVETTHLLVLCALLLSFLTVSALGDAPPRRPEP